MFFGIMTTIALAGGVVWVSNMEPEPDAHYLNARGIVDDYEIYTPESLRTPGSTIYDEALTELDLVDADSISAAAAAELKASILQNREDHAARASIVKDVKRRGRSARAARARELSRGQSNSTGLDPWAAERVTLAGSIEVCDHGPEGHDHDVDGH